MKIPLNKAWRVVIANVDEIDAYEPPPRKTKLKPTRTKIDQAIIQGLVSHILFHNQQQKPIIDVVNDVASYYDIDEKYKQNILKRILQ